MQRFIIGVIAEADGMTRDITIALSAMNNFRYRGQAPKFTEADLAKMDAALSTFHAHKNAILKAGLRRGKHGPLDNWHIPKLEFLQSVVPSIRANGAPIQWSADVTEHSHITEIKDPAAHSNNKNYEEQICRFLDRRDKAAQFDLSLAMENKHIHFVADDEDPEPLVDDEDVDGPLLVSTTSELLQLIEPTAR